MWIFENLSNWGKGGSVKHEKSERLYAEDMAHEQLRGWYQSVKYWGGHRYFTTRPSCTRGWSETHYFNSKGELVGKVYYEK